MDKVLQELVEFVKSASPVIWGALYKQVYVEALSFFLWAIGLVVLAVIFVRLAKWAMTEDDDFGNTELGAIFYILAGISGISAFAFLVSAIKWVANPEFYAIRFILQTLGGN